jgi:hypothetical protein
MEQKAKALQTSPQASKEGMKKGARTGLAPESLGRGCLKGSFYMPLLQFYFKS